MGHKRQKWQKSFELWRIGQKDNLKFRAKINFKKTREKVVCTVCKLEFTNKNWESTGVLGVQYKTVLYKIGVRFVTFLTQKWVKSLLINQHSPATQIYPFAFWTRCYTVAKTIHPWTLRPWTLCPRRLHCQTPHRRSLGTVNTSSSGQSTTNL